MLGLLEEDPNKRADTKEIQSKLEKFLGQPEKPEQDPDDGGRSTVTSINWNSQPIYAEYETETYHYKGETLNRKRHGNGICRYFEGNSVYEGSWRMNKEDGHGKFTFLPNCYYEGEFQNGKYHGQGTFVYPDGKKYKGKWRNGQKNGEGAMMYSNGNVMYTGEWKNGQMDGIGTFLYTNNAIYHGLFVNGKNEGMLGELTHPNRKVVYCIMTSNMKFFYEEDGNEQNVPIKEQGNGNVIEPQNVIVNVVDNNRNGNTKVAADSNQNGKRRTNSCSNCILI